MFIDIYFVTGVADSLQVIPSDALLDEVSNRLGNHAIHLGIELGLEFNEVHKLITDSSKSMFVQTFDILMKWKDESSVNTVYSLIVALKPVNASCANYVRKQFVS